MSNDAPGDSTDSLGVSDTPPPIAHPSGAQLVISRDLPELSRRAAELFVTLAQRAASVEGERFTVALSGGETPRSLYQLLATPDYASQIPWERVHVFWGDERHVPPDDKDSDYRMAHESLLAHVPIPAENVHRIRAELPDAAEAAREYAAELRGFFGLQPSELPRFNLVLLGMGGDGHTASLFPGTNAIHNTTDLVAAPWVEKLDTYRITLTAPVLNNAQAVVFLVAGAGKAGVLKEVLDGPRDVGRLPSQLIAPTNGDLIWMLDDAAAKSVTL